ncbi:MAG: pirin family protein, partial [Acidimicrobiia bacterium]|nr:pirin family protein [Acidimicrobiia bacterium]
MSVVLEHMELGFPWTCLDPFLFTVHHLDHYPEGHTHQGPHPDLLAGRPIGTDFTYQDGWSMYHGDKIPGFPQHPHRGFETVTVVRHGFVDHSDSLGATARYGEGDVQWLTTGSGIMHAEMFPLIHQDAPNTMELFQIWLNLPPRNKMVPAYFGMLWSEEIPTVTLPSGVTVDVIAGELDGHRAPAAPPDSWASQPGSDLAIWLIRMPADSEWTLPPTAPGVNRMLYCFVGSDAGVDATAIQKEEAVRLDPEQPARLAAGSENAEFLLLQGRPIAAPVFQMGPFVMNSPEELQQAFVDYRTTQFGGWPWARPDPVHDRTEGRFALHADGRVEHREMT